MDFVKVEHSLPSKSGRYLCVVDVPPMYSQWKFMDFYQFDKTNNCFVDIESDEEETKITHWAKIVFPT